MTTIENQPKEKNYEIVKKSEIKNTPFHTVVIDTEKGERAFIALGNQMLTDDRFLTKEDAEKYFKKNTWEFITKLVLIIDNQK